MKSVSLRMKGGTYFSNSNHFQPKRVYIFSDFTYYYIFKEQLQMKNDITLVDPRRQIET